MKKQLGFSKTKNAFDQVVWNTRVFSDLGRISNQEAIGRAYQSTQVEIGRKFAWFGENGACVIAAGHAGDVMFDKTLDVQLSETYKDSEVFKQEPELVINLLEYAFYSGNPLFGLIEALDKQILNRESAEEGVKYFRSIFKTLANITDTSH